MTPLFPSSEQVVRMLLPILLVLAALACFMLATVKVAFARIEPAALGLFFLTLLYLLTLLR